MPRPSKRGVRIRASQTLAAKYSESMDVFNNTFALLVINSILALSILSKAQNTITVSKFLRETICDVADRVDVGCSREDLNGWSFLKCLKVCAQSPSCIGASADTNSGNCFLHEFCSGVTGCSVPDNDHVYMTKYCGHGTWMAATQTCHCSDGSSGSRCQNHPGSCVQIYNAGFSPYTHRVVMDPDGLGPMLELCDNVHGLSNPSLVLFRNQGQIGFHFNRTWKEFRAGFFQDRFNLWAGFDNWYRLSQAGCNEVRFRFVVTTTGLPRLWRMYNGVVLSGPENHFAISYISPTIKEGKQGSNTPAGSLGDCLRYVVGVPFSTWDMDNDGDPGENCAARAGSGWWSAGCVQTCNIMGLGIDYVDTKPAHQIYSADGFTLSDVAITESFFEIDLYC